MSFVDELYLSYMEEAVNSFHGDRVSFFEVVGEKKNTYYLQDHLQKKYISPILAKPITQDKLIEFTGRFMDDNVRALETPGPTHMFTFSEKEHNFLYDLFGLNKDLVLKMCNEMYEVAYGSGKLFNLIREGPHKVLLTAIIVESIQKGYEDVYEACKYIMAFMEYPILYRRSWRIGVNEDVMNYTIEHLPNKFKIKKMKNVRELLKYDMNGVFALCRDRLKTGTDIQYVGFIQRCRSQLSASFVKIASAYYDNVEKNATQHAKDNILDDGNIADQEGNYAGMAQAIENTYTKFLSNGINARIASIAAEGNSVNKDILTTYINQIFTHKQNKLYKFIDRVITAYMSKDPSNTSLGSGEFLNFGLTLYRSIGTSKDQLYMEIRQILNFWMDDIISITKFYQNKGTIINYTRAIFNYMIMMINHHN